MQFCNVQHIEQTRYYLLDNTNQYISTNSILEIKFCLAVKVTSERVLVGVTTSGEHGGAVLT